jgi:chromosome segregation ATPase
MEKQIEVLESVEREFTSLLLKKDEKIEKKRGTIESLSRELIEHYHVIEDKNDEIESMKNEMDNMTIEHNEYKEEAEKKIRWGLDEAKGLLSNIREYDAKLRVTSLLVAYLHDEIKNKDRVVAHLKAIGSGGAKEQHVDEALGQMNLAIKELCEVKKSRAAVVNQNVMMIDKIVALEETVDDMRALIPNGKMDTAMTMASSALRSFPNHRIQVFAGDSLLVEINSQVEQCVKLYL